MKKLSFCALIFISFSALAQWNTNNSINTAVALAPKSQTNAHTISDSNNGMMMVWDDNRNDASTKDDIFAQRFNSSGVRKWALYGISICNSPNAQKNSVIAEVGNGSAIITWEDRRAGNHDIYAQKIDSSGNILWTTNGVAVCNKTTTQKSPKIVSDNAGGAIIVWEDSLNFYWDIYAQRISSSGALLWPTGGVAVCASPNTQANPRIEADGAGGAIITWQDKRNNSDYDIYAQKVDASGATQWTANGVVICNAVNTQNNPRIESDGANGAIIGWADKRNAIDNNIFAQRISAAGTVQWTANGMSVCNASNNQSAIDMKYIGSAGVVLSWKDERVSVNEIYAQLISLSGSAQLATNGIKLSSALKSLSPNVVSDGNGGAIVAWQDSTALGWDITSQKLNAAGAIQWAPGGVVVCDANDDQLYVSQVSDGNGGAIYAWEDHRNGSDYDIYAHHLYAEGTPVVGIRELSKTMFQSSCFPNPINANSVIQIMDNNSNKPWEITIFDGTGKPVKANQIKSNEVYVLNPVDYAAGVYFYVITIKDETSYSKGSFISVNRN
ncbi:MAG: T9SS type A sorting domain-containing protein [Bacteroidota bacterium]